MSTLNINSQSFYQQGCPCSRTAGPWPGCSAVSVGLQSGEHSRGAAVRDVQTRHSRSEERGGARSWRRGEHWEVVMGKTPGRRAQGQGCSSFSLAACGGFLLAGLLPGKEKAFLPRDGLQSSSLLPSLPEFASTVGPAGAPLPELPEAALNEVFLLRVHSRNQPRQKLH